LPSASNYTLPTINCFTDRIYFDGHPPVPLFEKSYYGYKVLLSVVGKEMSVMIRWQSKILVVGVK